MVGLWRVGSEGTCRGGVAVTQGADCGTPQHSHFTGGPCGPDIQACSLWWHHTLPHCLPPTPHANYLSGVLGAKWKCYKQCEKWLWRLYTAPGCGCKLCLPQSKSICAGVWWWCTASIAQLIFTSDDKQGGGYLIKVPSVWLMAMDSDGCL